MEFDELENINFDIKTYTNKDGWYATISLNMPYIDKNLNKISFSNNILGTVSVNKNNGQLKYFQSHI